MFSPEEPEQSATVTHNQGTCTFQEWNQSPHVCECVTPVSFLSQLVFLQLEDSTSSVSDNFCCSAQDLSLVHSPFSLN